MVWEKPTILQELRRLHKAGKAISYNALTRSAQSLVSAAAYHFGSFRKAVELAGIDYAAVTRRPRWNKQLIIAEIKRAKRAGENLYWAAVIKRRDELGKAAFAALQPRLFGRWDRALQAAGLDADDVSKYRKWDRNSIIFELKSRSQGNHPLNSGAIQADDPGLHAAVMRNFKTFDDALRAANLSPDEIRQRRKWTKAEVIKAIKELAKNGESLADSRVRINSPALYGASVRLFKKYSVARKAAGVKYKKK